MDRQRAAELAKELSVLGQWFWAGEAEVCRTFFSQPRTKEEHVRWLRLQCFKEMYGSGVSGDPKGVIRGPLEQLIANLPELDTQKDRREFEYRLRFIHEEFTHYNLFADILEGLSGAPVRLEDLPGYQLPGDRKLQEVRDHFRRSDERVGAAAVGFTEGGGSALFYEGMKLRGDPGALLGQIGEACSVVYTDELEHQQHGAREAEEELSTEEEWGRAREMVIAICQQRLRMRCDQFGLPISEQRIQEVTEGKVEPLPTPS